MRMERATLIASLIVALSCTAARISEPQPGWLRVDSGESLNDVPREEPLSGVSVLRPPSQGRCDHSGWSDASNLIFFLRLGRRRGSMECPLWRTTARKTRCRATRSGGVRHD